MRAVVDTNVIAYHLIGAPRFVNEIERFLTATPELLAPALWEAEIVNALWMSVRAGVLTPDESIERLALASGLGIQSLPIRTLWAGALIRSLESGVAVYDTLFVELAEREGTFLATYDRKILQAYPGIARRPGEFAA